MVTTAFAQGDAVRSLLLPLSFKGLGDCGSTSTYRTFPFPLALQLGVTGRDGESSSSLVTTSLTDLIAGGRNDVAGKEFDDGPATADTNRLEGDKDGYL